MSFDDDRIDAIDGPITAPNGNRRLRLWVFARAIENGTIKRPRSIFLHDKQQVDARSGFGSLLLVCCLSSAFLTSRFSTQPRVIIIYWNARRAIKGTVMRNLLRCLCSKNVALVLVSMMMAPGAIAAKEDALSLPKNAQAKSYGSGWECVRGFIESKGQCEKIIVPPDAYPTSSSYGRFWECQRGYKLKNETCVAIKVPTHGYLASYGDQWRCNRGYVAAEDDCVAVNVPENAYLADDSYGRGWECERGFAANDKGCVPVILPPNAHLDFSGTRWECDRSYDKRQNQCVRP